MKKLDSKNLEKDNNNAKSRGLLLSLVVSALVIGITGVAYIRLNSGTLYPSSKPEVTEADAQKFINALAAGKEKEAILAAATIIPDDSPELPNPDFIHLCSDNGLGTLLLTSKFNHLDYLRWKDAWEIKKIVDSYKEKDDPLNALFNEVLKRKDKSLKKISDKVTSRDKSYSAVIDIWKNGDASFPELMRLFSAMAYQLGYEVQIVSFYDDSFKPVYVVCELRKNDESYVVDVVCGSIWKDTTISQLEVNPEPVKSIWTENILKSIKRRAYRLPAEAMDYKLFNRQLNAGLRELGVENLPRFGENPQFRIDRYIKKYLNNSQNMGFSYWNFPFKSLMSSPNFPKEWKLPPKGGSDPSTSLRTGSESDSGKAGGESKK